MTKPKRGFKAWIRKVDGKPDPVVPRGMDGVEIDYCGLSGGGGGWYIVRTRHAFSREKYLRCDLRWHDTCGPDGFYCSKELAECFLKAHFALSQEN